MQTDLRATSQSDPVERSGTERPCVAELSPDLLLRTWELSLRERELSFEKERLRQATPPTPTTEARKTSRWTSPLLVAVTAASIGLCGSVFVAKSNQEASRTIEATKLAFEASEAQRNFLMDNLKSMEPARARAELAKSLWHGQIDNLDVQVLALLRSSEAIQRLGYDTEPVTLAWDPTDESERVAGYLALYWAADGKGDVIDVGRGTTGKFREVVVGMPYYYTVVAYNAYGRVSLPALPIRHVASVGRRGWKSLFKLLAPNMPGNWDV